MPRLRVGVIFGGRSGEHEVSLASAASIIAALEQRGHSRGAHRHRARRTLGRRRRSDARAGRAGARRAAERRRRPARSRRRWPTGPRASQSAAVERLGPLGARRQRAERAPPGARRRLRSRCTAPTVRTAPSRACCELADVPYVGAGVLASAVGMDKATMKTVFRRARLADRRAPGRHAPRVATAQPAAVAARIAERLGFPCFVKPVEPRLERRHQQGEGGRSAAPPRSTPAARYDRKLIVERGVRAREIEVSVLGNDAPEASLPGEIVYEGEWYDYATKYAEGQIAPGVPGARGARADRALPRAGDRGVPRDRLRRHGPRGLLPRRRPARSS